MAATLPSTLRRKKAEPLGVSMLRRIVESGNVPGIGNPLQTLRDIGLLVRNRDACEEVQKMISTTCRGFLIAYWRSTLNTKTRSSIGVTAGYAHGTPTVIQNAVDKLAEPRGEVVEFARRAV